MPAANVQSTFFRQIATIGTNRALRELAENWGLEYMGILTWILKGKSAEEDIDPTSTCSAEEYEEFINYLRGKDRAFSKPGRTIKEEFKFWMLDRAKKQHQDARYNASRHFAAATQK